METDSPVCSDSPSVMTVRYSQKKQCFFNFLLPKELKTDAQYERAESHSYCDSDADGIMLHVGAATPALLSLHKSAVTADVCCLHIYIYIFSVRPFRI